MTDKIKQEIKIKAKQVTENLISFMQDLDTDNNKTIKELLIDCEFYKSEISKLQEQNTNLQIMLKAEREVRCNEDYLKHVTKLEDENEQLQQKYLSESYEKAKLLEQIEDLKKYCCEVSKFLHDNNNVKEDNSIYKKRDILLVKELKLFEKLEQK